MLLTVAQILPEMHSGGVERGTLEVAQALVDAGHRSIVISAGGRLVEALERAGTKHIKMPVGRKSLRTLGLVRKLRRLLLAESVNVLHARSRVPAWLCRLALYGMSQRPGFVTTVHGLYSVNRFSRVMTSGDQVVCVSKTVRDYVTQNYPATNEAKLSVIHRGVDPKRYRPDYRAPFEWERRFRDELELGSNPLVLLPGRLTRLKGHHDFLGIMDRLGEAGSNAVGVIVGGEDPRREAYAKEIEAATGSRKNVVMAGHRSDLREIMSISSAVVSLSQKPESFGRTVLESLALGTPVIGYDYGGVSEILAELFPEGAIPVGDLAAAATGLSSILGRDSAVPIQMNERFTLSAMRARLLRIYVGVGATNPSLMKGAEQRRRTA